jgi:bacteriorhodopsin
MMNGYLKFDFILFCLMLNQIHFFRYGVIHKDEAGGQVTIFWARYVDRLFTTPVIAVTPLWSYLIVSDDVNVFQLILLDIALLVRAEAGETVMLVGNDILMVIAGLSSAFLCKSVSGKYLTQVSRVASQLLSAPLN